MITLKNLYAPIEPYRRHRLAVSPIHNLYVEECGNPAGLPVLFVHGGPGEGTRPDQRRFFDPAAYRIILFDQRGCGQSTPFACVEENTTWHLVADMECIREFLGIDKWTLFGGSWGSALSLAYAQRHPARVAKMILRGIFMLRPFELGWFYQSGASFVYPDAWADFLAPIPQEERGDLLSAYYRRLNRDDLEARQAAAAWTLWEGRTSFLDSEANMPAAYADPTFAWAFARIESHFFQHGGFFEYPNQLLDGVAAIRHIPAVIVQGRYDMVCPVQSAWELANRWPEAKFDLVLGGHSAFEPALTDQLVAATQSFAKHGGDPAATARVDRA